MKITKRQLRRIIREEKARLAEIDRDALMDLEARERADDRGDSIDTDTAIVVDQLEYAFFEALEELGAGAQAATSITRMLKTTAYLDTALDNGLEDYLKKLKMMGGMPKPRSV